MIIGIDFDNTIACYDGVFYRAALDRGLIPSGLSSSKNSVRDHLNATGQKEVFTELQGYVYGHRMDLVAPYPGFSNFIFASRNNQHQLYIVSHKTRFPIIGPRYDMHAAARKFLTDHNLIGDHAIAEDHIFFELTKEEKIKRAAILKVDIFIDDLPEILSMDGFPTSCKKILFDPNLYHQNECRFSRGHDWDQLQALVHQC